MSDKTFQIVNGDISDGYHTFDELYDHRCLLFLAWMQSAGCPGNCYVVYDHFDGWDLLVCELEPNASHVRPQISYHIPVKYRSYLRHYPERDVLDHKFDGHTSSDVLSRIKRWMRTYEDTTS